GARPPRGPGRGPARIRGLRGHGAAAARAHRGGGGPPLAGHDGAGRAPAGIARHRRGQRGRGGGVPAPGRSLRGLPLGHRHPEGHRAHLEEGVRPRRRLVDGGPRHLHARPGGLRQEAVLTRMRWMLETLWVLVVIVVPALGVWLASSLAVYRNGPVWLAVACGLLLFPGLPLAWETWSRRGSDKEKK